MHKILTTAGFIFEELSEDEFSDSKDLGREFFKFMKSKLLTDMTKKIKVSDFIKEKILEIDSSQFDEKYQTNLTSLKKTKQQFDFLTNIVTQMFKYSSKNDIVDW